MIETRSNYEQRTEKQIREHYEVEHQLAARLRNSKKQERRGLYQDLYEQLYQLIPHHPQLSQKKSPQQQQQSVKNKMNLLTRLLNKNSSFLEVGPGDCALAFEVANFVKDVFAVDISETITNTPKIPKNFQLFLSDGCKIPVAKNSIDIIYSNQLMEHLHPDDAYEQLQNILTALAPGGIYLCITPNRLNGPHDISKYFDEVATGFHIKEYTVNELSQLFKQVGFSKVIMYIGGQGKYFKFPIFPAIWCERILEQLPSRLRQMIANTLPIKALININLLGIK